MTYPAASPSPYAETLDTYMSLSRDAAPTMSDPPSAIITAKGIYGDASEWPKRNRSKRLYLPPMLSDVPMPRGLEGLLAYTASRVSVWHAADCLIALESARSIMDSYMLCDGTIEDHAKICLWIDQLVNVFYCLESAGLQLGVDYDEDC
tara:strand:- start:43 stop:489 length:447 start_codon:yes stop_codon:yes gene_type:complete